MKSTANYLVWMANLIHKAWRKSCVNRDETTKRSVMEARVSRAKRIVALAANGSSAVQHGNSYDDKVSRSNIVDLLGENFPRMPVTDTAFPHREHLDHSQLRVQAMISVLLTRIVSRRELKDNPKAGVAK